jgi:hypothetical protein
MVRDNKKAFTPAPEGLHQAVCVDVVDLGLVEGPRGAKPTVELRWELDLTNEETGCPYLVSKRYSLTLNEKGNLRPMLEAWRGRPRPPITSAAVSCSTAEHSTGSGRVLASRLRQRGAH